MQGKYSRCPIHLLLLLGSPAQADEQVDLLWLSLSPWPSLSVPKITHGKNLWCAGADVVPGCSTRDGRCLHSVCHLLVVAQGIGDAFILCATFWLWYLYKQLSDRACQVRSNIPSFLLPGALLGF